MAQLPIRILIGRDDVTRHVEEGLQFSNVDPGGYEAATMSFPRQVSARKAEPVLIVAGQQTAWAGRVQRVARKLAGGAGSTVSCEGHGARFKETLVQEVWIDRDLSRWVESGTARKIGLGATRQYGSLSALPDAAGNPALELAIRGPWSSPNTPIIEAWYFAGGVPIRTVYYSLASNGNPGSGDTNWHLQYHLLDDDTAVAPFEFLDDIWDAGAQGSQALPAAGYATGAVARPYAMFNWVYGVTPAGGEIDYVVWLRNVATYGDHGLPRRGSSDPAGFYPSDIARDVLRRVSGVRAGTIEDATGFIVPHAVAYTPVPCEQVIGEQALLAGGFHWGTWAPQSMLDSDPVFDFRSLPTRATCSTTRRDCDDLELEEDLTGLYNRATVSYQRAGATRVVTVSRQVDELDEAGLERTLPADLGEGTAESAATYGQFLLALSERAARASGSATTTLPVKDAGGGEKAAYLLRSGIDKLKVTDLPELPLFAQGRDEFQLKRVTGTAGRAGISTALELGTGADLQEVLNARLTLQVQVATFGR